MKLNMHKNINPFLKGIVVFLHVHTARILPQADMWQYDAACKSLHMNKRHLPAGRVWRMCNAPSLPRVLCSGVVDF